MGNLIDKLATEIGHPEREEGTQSAVTKWYGRMRAEWPDGVSDQAGGDGGGGGWEGHACQG